MLGRWERPWHIWGSKRSSLCNSEMDAGGRSKGEKIQKSVGTRLTDCFIYQTWAPRSLRALSHRPRALVFSAVAFERH